MASRSSQRKNASVTSLQAVQSVLQDGAVLEMPNPRIIAAASQLEDLQIIDAARMWFVRCSNPRDPDYPPVVRDCPGRIRVQAEDDVASCPDCGRDVDLQDLEKRRYEGLKVRIREEGVMAYLASAANGFGMPLRPSTGVLRFRAESADVYLCVAELCDDDHRRRRDTAANDPTVVVTLEPSGPSLALPEPWLIRTTLAALVTGHSRLEELLRAAAAQGHPTTLLNASVPIYSRGARPIIASPLEARPVRQFVLRVTHDNAYLESVLIASRRAPVQLTILQLLAKHFIRSLLTMSGAPFDPLSADQIANRLQRLTNKEREDRESVRKSINRLQDGIAVRVRRSLGLPIGREDIIQTVAWQGQEDPYGYRLNPLSVVIGHCSVPATELSGEISNCLSPRN